MTLELLGAGSHCGNCTATNTVYTLWKSKEDLEGRIKSSKEIKQRITPGKQ